MIPDFRLARAGLSAEEQARFDELYAHAEAFYERTKFPTYLEPIFDTIEDGKRPILAALVRQVVRPHAWAELVNQPPVWDQRAALQEVVEKLRGDIENIVLLTAEQACILLGRRTTAGALDVVLPITYAKIASAALEREPGGDERTKFNRALCKHFHRKENSYWGTVSGPVAVSNAATEERLRRLLEREIEWINWHQVAPGELYYELRNAQGWGARWKIVLNGELRLEFRGVVDPFVDEQEKLQILSGQRPKRASENSQL